MCLSFTMTGQEMHIETDSGRECKVLIKTAVEARIMFLRKCVKFSGNVQYIIQQYS